MITAHLEGQTLALRGDTYARREEIRLLGGYWDEATKVWRLPATVDAARAAVAGLGAKLLDGAAKLAIAPAEVPWPEGMVTRPWPHQERTFQFCASRGGSVAAVCLGGGKSLIALALLLAWDARLALVSCPLSVLDVWRREAERHTPGKFYVHVLDPKKSVAAKAKQLDAILAAARRLVPRIRTIVVVNHDSIWRGVLGELVLAMRWDALILDEAHRLKSPGGKASRFVARIRAPHRLGLTGTFLPNGPLDAYGQLRAIDRSVFGSSFVTFRSRFAVMGGFGGHQVLSWQNQAEFRERLGRAVIRVTREDAALSLPPELDTEVWVDLSPKARAAYDEMRVHMIAEVEGGDVTASNVLVKTLRLAQLANGLAQTEDGGRLEILCDAKRQALADVIDATDDPAVVFCRFRHDLARASSVAQEMGRRVGELSGPVKDLLDDRACMREDVDVGAVQLQSGGVGVDMTRASVAVYMGLSWSAADYEQSRARLHRPGQTKPVTFVHLLARGTIDATIRAALKAKIDLAEAIMADLRGKP